MEEGMDESQLLQTGDMILTQHSAGRYYGTLVTGLLSQKNSKQIKVYLDVLSKFLKMFLGFYKS
jgi:hypothetical protein